MIKASRDQPEKRDYDSASEGPRTIKGSGIISLEPRQRIILALRKPDELKDIAAIELDNISFSKDKVVFMIDTGASVNLLKENALSPIVWINKKRVIKLVGIDLEMVSTIGEVRLIIKGLEASFHIVPLSFPISEDGILGTPFLKKHNAIVNFETDRLQIGEVDFPFVHHGTICLPARTKKLVKIQLLNRKLKEGYIRRIQCGPGIFAGESLVFNDEGSATIFFINSNN